MKRLWILCLVGVILAISLFGCTEADTEGTSGTSQEETVKLPPLGFQGHSFASAEELSQALLRQPPFHSQLWEELDTRDYGQTYTDFLELFSGSASTAACSLRVPAMQGMPMRIKSEYEWQRVTLFQKEMFGLPWIWYYCDYNGQTVVISISYTALLQGEEPLPSDFAGLLQRYYPESPSPETAEQFSGQYAAIYERLLSVGGGRELSAVVYERRDNGRVCYRFLWDEVIASVWTYEGEALPDSFWTDFSLQQL